MQFRNFFHLLVFSVLFFGYPSFSNGQILDSNEDNEQIVVFPDGRWEYYDSSKATHRLAMQKYQDSLTSPDDLFSSDLNNKGDSTEASPHAILVEAAEEELATAKEKENDARLSRVFLSEQLKKMKADKTINSEAYQLAKKQLKHAEKVEKAAKKKRKLAEKKLKKIRKNKDTASGKKQKKASSNKLKKIDRRQKKLDRELQDSEVAYQEDDDFYVASKKFKKYSMDEDVMYQPPTPDCQLEFDGIDEFIGKKRKDVARDLFFTHTEEDMRRYMKEEEYIICEGNLTQISGGTLLLNLFFSIKTNDAQRAFGQLNKGSVILIKLINGTKITLANNQSDAGVYNNLTRRHNYTAQYIINAGQEKQLKTSEVDKVRVIWETGYEDYEVYNLDFFKHQMRCLKN
ncbi:MAG: hypothetical protein AAF573_18725 [Bacteroidota bacterium]